MPVARVRCWRWTCSRCGKVVETPRRRLPGNWLNLIALDLEGEGVPVHGEADFCSVLCRGAWVAARYLPATEAEAARKLLPIRGGKPEEEP